MRSHDLEATVFTPASVPKKPAPTRYGDQLKAELIQAHLRGAKFEDLARAHGPCADSIRRWFALYLRGTLILPGLEPVATSPTSHSTSQPQRSHSFIPLGEQKTSSYI
jgi:transposase-like protein